MKQDFFYDWDAELDFVSGETQEEYIERLKRELVNHGVLTAGEAEAFVH